MRILVVEDNQIEQELLRAHLSIMGLEAEIVATARDAMARLTSHTRYALVLTDYKLREDINGIDLLKLTREASDMNADTPFIAVTACAMKGDREDQLAAGMSGYVSKPYRHSELRRAIEAVLTDAECHARGAA